MRELSKSTLQPTKEARPFKVTPPFDDVASLAEAIAAKPFVVDRRPTGPLTIYKVINDKWVQVEEDDMVHVNCKATSYGYFVPEGI